MKAPRTGIDNYGLYPLQLSPMDTLRWAKENGAEGVAFSGLNTPERELINSEYLHDLKQFAADNDLYIEWGGAQHIPRDMTTWEKKEIFSTNQQAAEEAEILGTRIVRSCSGGLMRWKADSPSTETLLEETAKELKSQRSMLMDHNAILAIETHFEFTTFELLRLFEMCEAEPGEHLGVCLDTMNLLTMLEDPLAATQRVLPWVVSTHIKDGAVLLNDGGLISFTAEISAGVIDLERIIAMLKTLPYPVNLSLEDHGGDFTLPIFDKWFISQFPDLEMSEYNELIRLSQITRAKVNAGQLGIIYRNAWGAVCEARLKKDLKALKRIRERMASRIQS